MSIEKSYTVEKERFEAVTGLKIDERILLVAPQGHRMIVMVNQPPEDYGLIRLPDEWRNTERGGSGWVISVGPLCGMHPVPHPGAPIVASPAELLYQQCIIGQHSGKVIRMDLLHTSTKSPYLILTDRDVWAWDMAPSEHLEKA